MDERLLPYAENSPLMHAGVKGMKWGKRKNLNPNYSEQQYKRDREIYGKRGANRINKALNKGDQISTARGVEKTKRDTVIGRNKYVRQVGKLGGGAVGAVIGFAAARGINTFASSSVGQKVAERTLGQYSNLALNALKSPVAMAAITAGSAKVGYMLSGDIAVDINMRSAGYNSNRR